MCKKSNLSRKNASIIINARFAASQNQNGKTARINGNVRENFPLYEDTKANDHQKRKTLRAKIIIADRSI